MHSGYDVHYRVLLWEECGVRLYEWVYRQYLLGNTMCMVFFTDAS
jgi:hypothetical protein